MTRDPGRRGRERRSSGGIKQLPWRSYRNPYRPVEVLNEEQLEKMEKLWKGLPPAAAAKEQLDAFGKDPTIKKELGASRALQKLVGRYDPSKIAQARKLAEELGKFAKKYEGTHAAKQAEVRRQRLSGR